MGFRLDEVVASKALAMQHLLMAEVSFRAMTERDLPTVLAWLGEPHVQQWWRGPVAADGVEAKYLPRIRGEEGVEMLVILWGGRAVGMIQRYRITDTPDGARSLAPTGLDVAASAGIDYLIGEPDLIGRGIGADAVRAFSIEVFDRYADVEQIIVTPQAANAASCAVLEKIGYRRAWTGMLDSSDPYDSATAALYVLRRDGVA